MTTLAGPRPRSWAEFNRFWLSQSFAQLAGQILNYGFPLIAVEALGLSASQVAATTALQFLPTLVITPCAGLIVDRVPKVTLVRRCHVGRGIVLALAAMLAYTGSLGTAAFWSIVLVSGALNAMASIGTLALVPELAPESSLVKANSRMQLSMSITQVLGPALAGALVGFSGQLVLGSIAVVFAAAALLLLRTRTVPPVPDPARAPWPSQFAAGAAFVRRVPLLRALLVEMTLFNVFEQSVITLFTLFALRELGFEAGLVGLVLGAGALGSVLGAGLSGRSKNDPDGDHAGKLMWGIGAASFSPFLVVALPDGSVPVAAGMAAVTFFFYGLGLTTFNVHSNAVRHRLAPGNLQGRIAAVYRTIVFTAVALGAGLAGTLVLFMTFRQALFVSCTGLVASYLLFVVLMRRARDAALPEEVTVVAAVPVIASEEETPVPDQPLAVDHIEAEIVSIWASTLGVDDIAPDDDFFDLGGNSITAIRLLPVLTERFGVEPSIGVIFDNPTAKELALAIADVGGRVGE